MRLIRVLLPPVLLASGAAFAQADTGDSAQPATNIEVSDYFVQRQKAISQEHRLKLAEIDEAYGEATQALGAENVARLQAIYAANSEAHKEVSEKGLVGEERAAETQRIQAETQQAREELFEWMQASRQEIDAEHKANRAAQFAENDRLIAEANEERAAMLARLVNSPINPGLLTVPQDGEAQSGDNSNQVAKSGSSGETLYFEHCDLCHGTNPGTRQSRYDLYEAVVVDDAAYFLDRVRNGPGQMPDIDEIQELSDAEVYSIRDFVRRAGDINTGVVVVDDAEKTPDPDPGTDSGGSPAGPVAGSPSGLPPVTPGSPLPGTGPAGSDAVRDAQTQSFGEAELTCNVRGNVEVSWIAPFSWDSGWIPPGGTMNETGVRWEESWMLRLRAKLEDPTESDGSRNPAPGWCTYAQGSLGSVAGGGRDIVIFAHARGRPFEQFRFANGDVDVFKSNSSSADRGGRFAVDVLLVAHGLIMPAGNRSTGIGNEVVARVQRIDDRWSQNGWPAFLVIND